MNSQDLRLPRDPQVLRDLADLYEANGVTRRNRLYHRLTSDEARDEYVNMLAANKHPTWQWIKTHTPVVQPSWPPMPPADRARIERSRQWQPWELTVAAIDMAESGMHLDDARDVLAQLAVDHHLDAHHLADAYIALEDRP